MKYFYIFLLTGVILCGSCSKNNKVARMLDGTWTVSSYQLDPQYGNGTSNLTGTFNFEKCNLRKQNGCPFTFSGVETMTYSDGNTSSYPRELTGRYMVTEKGEYISFRSDVFSQEQLTGKGIYNYRISSKSDNTFVMTATTDGQTETITLTKQ